MLLECFAEEANAIDAEGAVLLDRRLPHGGHDVAKALLGPCGHGILYKVIRVVGM